MINDPLDGLLDEVVTTHEKSDLSPVGFSFITGPAGTGKTQSVKEKARQDPTFRLCATTGIAAVNLDTVTLNAVLKFFDTQSLMDARLTGRLTRRLRELAEDPMESLRTLCIDEVSMMPAAQLDAIYDCIQEANLFLGDHPISLVLTGDFAQLPPVSTKESPARFAFHAGCWPPGNIERLTKVWRQTDPEFLEALREARAGNGQGAAGKFKSAGVKFAPSVNHRFQGTTIFSKNREVDLFNAQRLKELPGEPIMMRNRFRGEPSPDWRRAIPDCPGGKSEPLMLKPEALVMILANETRDYSYANGDLGIVKEIKPDLLTLEVLRTEATVTIPRIRRYHFGKEGDPGAVFVPELEGGKGAWVLGSMDWFPIRLGWATTVHKSQGLTLDNVQIDIRDWFFGSPNMAYVALSRSRTPQGLTLVGPSQVLAKQIKLHPEVKEWI